jgi:transketolase
MDYQIGELVPTRLAYGQALAELGGSEPKIVVLDAEVGNSTYAELFAQKFPERFFEMYIAEQSLVGAALGLSKAGKIPFASTFAAFFTRAFDQIRMAAYSKPNLKLCGSHAGVSIGEDGSSQMGLEDLAMMRALPGTTVLYPADAVATAKLVKLMAEHQGLDYLRTTRPATPVIYRNDAEFVVGGSQTLIQSATDRLTIVAAGITVHQALTAADKLEKAHISVRVIDAYSIKPLDISGLQSAAKTTNNLVLTAEDHRVEGGLGEAVAGALAPLGIKVFHLGVDKIPGSGRADELLAYANISANSIVRMVKSIL